MTVDQTGAISRRAMVGGLFSGTIALSGLASPAFALSKDGAKALIDQLVGEINKVIASGKSEGAMIRDFERIFGRYADVNIIARSALGADSRRASAGQLRSFTTAFRSYIARKYGKRFREFVGGRLEVNGTKTVRNAFQVSTTAYLRGEAPFEVTFHVGQKSGKFFNMFIEGVNMLLTERTEIGSMLDKRRGDIDAMISDLKKAG